MDRIERSLADGLVAPAFGRGCVTDLMPTLVGRPRSSPLPIEIDPGRPVVLFVLDGLGWDQLQERTAIAPNLTSFAGGPITTIAPSTTAAALTSITTGLPPGEHGIVGYRMVVGGEVLNTLRWRTAERGDARDDVPPEEVQPHQPFLGAAVPYVSRAEFATTAFSMAHLRGGRHVKHRTVGTLVHEVGRMVREGHELTYAYYDGVDKVSHEYGLDSTFDREVAFADWMVGAIVDEVPAGTQVVVTADHGQVDCGDRLLPIHTDVLEHCTRLSGEGRFRWLHGRAEPLLEAAVEHHADTGWVLSADEMIEAGWFGARVSPEARRRLGDVALLPFEPVAYEDPADTGPFELIGRHGSMTSAEMLVPCVVHTA